LPYTFSRDDYVVAWGETKLAPEVAAEAAAGAAVVMLYNLSSEVLADPPGLLERIYLRTGHETFARSVLSFGQRHCRYDCIPIRPLEDRERELAALAAEPRRAVAFYKKAPGPRRHVEEALLVFAAVRRHFDVRPAPIRPRASVAWTSFLGRRRRTASSSRTRLASSLSISPGSRGRATPRGRS